MNRFIVHQHFKLAADPWAGHQATGDARRVAAMVSGALAGALVSIAGARQVRRLSDPATVPRRGPARLLGAQRAVLVIDEAHLLHHQTLRAIKRLRELGARGRRTALLPVILMGQSDPTARVAEVGLRTDSLSLAGLSRAEVMAALAGAVGAVIPAPAAKVLAADARSRNWLDLQRLATDAMAAAMAVGDPQVTPDRVRQVLGGRGQQAGALMAAPMAAPPAAPSDDAVAEALAAVAADGVAPPGRKADSVSVAGGAAQ